MIQIQAIVEIDPVTHEHHFQLNVLEREDANDAERLVAEAIEELHCQALEAIAKQVGGTVRRIKRGQP